MKKWRDGNYWVILLHKNASREAQRFNTMRPNPSNGTCSQRTTNSTTKRAYKSWSIRQSLAKINHFLFLLPWQFLFMIFIIREIEDSKYGTHDLKKANELKSYGQAPCLNLPLESPAKNPHKVRHRSICSVIWRFSFLALHLVWMRIKHRSRLGMKNGYCMLGILRVKMN